MGTWTCRSPEGRPDQKHPARSCYTELCRVFVKVPIIAGQPPRPTILGRSVEIPPTHGSVPLNQASELGMQGFCQGSARSIDRGRDITHRDGHATPANVHVPRGLGEPLGHRSRPSGTWPAHGGLDEGASGYPPGQQTLRHRGLRPSRLRDRWPCTVTPGETSVRHLVGRTSPSLTCTFN